MKLEETNVQKNRACVERILFGRECHGKSVSDQFSLENVRKFSGYCGCVYLNTCIRHY